MKKFASIFFLLSIHAFAYDNYGAIAYSPSKGLYGYSYDYSSLQGAKYGAISRCHADDCKIVVWFKNGCGALATGTGGYGSGWGTTLSGAKHEALKACSLYSPDCHIVRWVCTTR